MENPRIAVLRLGHRPQRDKRITTHVALVARAFGAGSIIVAENDPELGRTVGDVVDKFGGEFSVQIGVNWKKFIRQWSGPVVHLTMYGERLEKAINNIPRDDILVVVGAEKVPSDVYKLADFNISVGNQPHSEVAALAIFLDRLTEAIWAKSRFEGRRRIIPSKKGKIVIDVEEGYLSDVTCLEILKEMGCEDNIVKHSKVVTELAVKMAELCKADVDLVRTAALLHDIGRIVTHGPEHGYEGARILRELGFPEAIVSIVERHVGGGLDAKEMKELGLPEKDVIPITLEEKIVCLADKLVDYDKRSPLQTEIRKLKDEGLDKAVERLKALHREMTEACGLNPEEIDM